MKIFKTGHITVADGDKTVININDNLCGDISVSELWLNTEDDIPVTVTVFSDPEGEGVDVPVIDMVNLAKVEADEITSAGLYLAILGNAARVELNYGGAGDLTYKVQF